MPIALVKHLRLAGAGVSLLLALLGTVRADDIVVQDHRMHIECRGHGQPTVVFDAGLGGSSLEWIYVEALLDPVTRVCVFDRPGYGDSDMGPLPRTSSNIADELYLLLEGAGIDGPYILVGHSFGGYNVQVFARRYPYLAAGLVLIDASHPEQVERFLAPPLRMLTAPSSRYGIVQFRDPPPPHDALPDVVKREIRARAKRRKTRRTLGSEMLAFRDSALQVQASPPLDDIPLLVISRGKLEGPATERRVLMERLWLDMQAELAAGSPLSAHLLARNSGHNVHIEQPELVAYGIALLIDRARAAAAGDAALAAFDWTSFPLRDAAWLSDRLARNAGITRRETLAWCDQMSAGVGCGDGAP